MSVPTTDLAQRDTRAAILMRVLVAVPLAVSGILHYYLASGPLASDGHVTLAGLFVAQAVVAVLVSVWVLVTGDRIGLLVAAVVALGSLAALVLSTYVKIPAMGPFPVIYDPSWYSDKVIAAVAAAAALVAAGAALARVRR